MEMALALASLALLLCATLFHMCLNSLNWHKNYGHWHGRAVAEHWHCQAVERRIVHEMMVRLGLQGSVMVVVLCYCCCFGQTAVVAAMTMEGAMMSHCRL